jgi:hypothetical protein
MSKTSKPARTADEIAEMASRGKDVSGFFTNKFTFVDLTQRMLRELDAGAGNRATEGRRKKP